MKMEQVKQIANAVLYEGYLLYPYRHSAIKNRQRWTFGVVYPRAYSEMNGGIEPWNMRTECLITGQPGTTLDITVRFLHLLKRSIEQPAITYPGEGYNDERGQLLLAGQLAYEPWEEGIEREVNVLKLPLREVLAKPRRVEIAFPGRRLIEQPPNEQETGIVREQEALSGAVIIAAERVPHAEHMHVYKVSVRIENTTPVFRTEQERRHAILLQSFVSTHTLLRVDDGEFISLLETPDEFQAAAHTCQNSHTWPVLVGDAGEHCIMLSSPIILYDYPQIAPESPGALFDGTEIDEILALRILTLSDEEKEEIRRGDVRGRELLERIESLTPEQFARLHGTIREIHPRKQEQSHMAQRVPSEPAQAYPGADYQPPALVELSDKEIHVGDRVRLHPHARADAFDILLADKTARIENIQQDFENRLYLVVTLDDDPGREQWDERVLPGHRFFFFPTEVELLEE